MIANSSLRVSGLSGPVNSVAFMPNTLDMKESGSWINVSAIQKYEQFRFRMTVLYKYDGSDGKHHD